MINQINIKRYWRDVYNSVIEQYAELKATRGTPSSEQFYDFLEKQGIKGTKNPKVVLPNSLDFIADVELAAKASLHPDEYVRFKKAVVEGEEYTRSIGWRNIQEKVGKMLLARRIYPSALYFSSSVGQKIKRCSCGSKEHSAVETSQVFCAGGCGLNTLWHEVGMFDKHPLYGHTICWCIVCTEKDDARLEEEYERRSSRTNSPRAA